MHLLLSLMGKRRAIMRLLDSMQRLLIQLLLTIY